MQDQRSLVIDGFVLRCSARSQTVGVVKHLAVAGAVTRLVATGLDPDHVDISVELIFVRAILEFDLGDVAVTVLDDDV